MTTGQGTTDTMSNVSTNGDRHYGFVMGLITGSVVGVGLGMLFAPRAALELRNRAVDAAKGLGDEATDRYRQATSQIGDAVDEVTRKGQGLRDDLSDAVIRGAKGVERLAANAKTGH